MGSISPVPFASGAFMQKTEERIIRRTVEGLKMEGIPYSGFIFFGLINVQGDPFVIEYNCRMGDPETESVIPRIRGDLLELFVHLSEGTLSQAHITFDEGTFATVVLVSGGYPDAYPKGKVISGLDQVTESILFHAGTRRESESSVVTNGGRVLAVTSRGENLAKALETCYKTASGIDFEGIYYRKDIGFDLH
jgi:phosphoribosylamine--glycine ligase